MKFLKLLFLIVLSNNILSQTDSLVNERLRIVDSIQVLDRALAKSYLDSIIQQEDLSPLFYMKRGEINKELENYELALRDYSFAIELENLLTQIFIKQGQYFIGD